MYCKHCGTKEARVHFRSNVNGQVIDRHLCTDCAAILQGAVFGGFGAMRPGEYVHTPAVVPEPRESRIPLEADLGFRKRRHLGQLQAELQSAIAAEQFERAADLRDEIHQLERAE